MFLFLITIFLNTLPPKKKEEREKKDTSCPTCIFLCGCVYELECESHMFIQIKLDQY
jgi:hypothetical protein